MSSWTMHGVLRRDKATGLLHATLIDALGTTIDITGTHQPDGTYALVGVMGPVPESLRLPTDDPPA